MSGSSVCAPPLPAADPVPGGPGLWVDVLGSRRNPSGADEIGVVGRTVVDLRPGRRYGVPVLIHLLQPKLDPDDLEDRLAVLDKAIRVAETPVMATVVLGDGQAAPDPQRPTPLAFARDPEGRWAKAWRMRPGTTVLLTPEGGVAARTGDDVEVEALARVIREAAGKTPLDQRRPAAWSLATAKVRQGESAPPLMVPRYGRWIPLRKLRGDSVALCFWSPRGPESLATLRRLAEEQAEGGSRVVPVHPAADDDLVKAALEKHGIDRPSVPDDGTTARDYGIRLWPTTVHVDRRGRIARLRYGHHT